MWTVPTICCARSIVSFLLLSKVFNMCLSLNLWVMGLIWMGCSCLPYCFWKPKHMVLLRPWSVLRAKWLCVINTHVCLSFSPLHSPLYTHIYFQYVFRIKEKIIERLLCSYTHCPLCIFVNQPCIKCLFTWLINILLKSWFSDLRFLLFFFFWICSTGFNRGYLGVKRGIVKRECHESWRMPLWWSHSCLPSW